LFQYRTQGSAAIGGASGSTQTNCPVSERVDPSDATRSGTGAGAGPCTGHGTGEVCPGLWAAVNHGPGADYAAPGLWFYCRNLGRGLGFV